MAQITKLFTKGLDTDTAPHLQDKESYSSAMNVHFSLGSLLGPSDGQGGGMESYNTGGDTGVIEPFAGNTDWTSLFTTMPGLPSNPRNYVRGYDQNGAKCIGYATDDTESLSSNTRYIYLFIHTPQYGNPIESPNSYIVKVALQYDASGSKITTIKPSQSSVLLNGEWVYSPNGDDGLAFSANDFISARVSGNQLIFTDGRNPVRYVDVDKDYSVFSPNGLTQEQLSLITEPGHVPLVTERYSNLNLGTTIQQRAVQFTYRITNEDGFISVLSPYSLTSLPPWQEQLDIDPLYNNVIKVSMLKNQIIPSNWSKIDFVVKYLDTEVFQVIRTFDKEDQTVRRYWYSGVTYSYYTDEELVNAHNDALNPDYIFFAGDQTDTSVFFTNPGWDGTNIIETLSSAYTSKQFDNIPITSKALEIAANRLFLANNVEGYDTPTTAPDDGSGGPGLTVVKNTIATDAVVDLLANPYIITAEVGLYCWGAIITQISGLTGYYAYPMDCQPKKFYNTFNAGMATVGSEYIFNGVVPFSVLPKQVSIKSMIHLKSNLDPSFSSPGFADRTGATAAIAQARGAILSELFSDFNYSATTHDSFFLGLFKTEAYPFGNPLPPFNPVPDVQNTAVVDKANWETSSNIDRAFFPSSNYNYGLQYYDAALRKSGVQNIGSIKMDDFEYGTRTLVESIDFSITNLPQSSNVIPSWAKYYSITLSKNNQASTFIQFIPEIIKYAYKDNDNIVVFNENSNTTNLNFYGFAIPLNSIVSDGLGYTYAKGDLVRLEFSTYTSTATVLATLSGYVIVSIDKTYFGARVSTQSTEFRIYYAGASINSRGYYPCHVNFFGTGISDVVQQDKIIATIITPNTTSNIKYEIAAFGNIEYDSGLNQTTYGNFYSSNSLTQNVLGDTYTQSRDGAGSLTCVSISPLERYYTNWVGDFGRIAPVDRIGQQGITNGINWSNVKIPNSQVNGLSSFDALDTTSVDASAGPITTIFLSSKEANQGGRLLVLCNSGSFIALVGQQQIYSADQTTALTSASNVIGTILPLTNMWGCISPQSVVGYKGVVFWADALNREIIQFAGDGASPISQQKAGFLWNQVFRNLPFDSSSNSAVNIKCGINPYTYELFVTCPNPSITGKQYPGNCGDNHINQYIGNKNVSYAYNWQANAWIGAYEDNPDQWIRVGDDVFSIGSQYGTTGLKLYKEFDNTPGVFNQTTTGAWIAAPYSIGTYPSTIEPLSVILMGQLTTTSTVIYARDNSTNVNNNLTQISLISDGNYAMREGEMFSSVYRNRLSNNATTNTEYDTQNIAGDRIRTKTPWVQLNFPTNQQINLQGIRLEVKQSSGH
jgi:hypothetical protein